MKTYTRAIGDLDAGKLPEWEALPVNPFQPCTYQKLRSWYCAADVYLKFVLDAGKLPHPEAVAVSTLNKGVAVTGCAGARHSGCEAS